MMSPTANITNDGTITISAIFPESRSDDVVVVVVCICGIVTALMSQYWLR